MDKDALIRQAFELRLKQVVLTYARDTGSDVKAYRLLHVPKATFYRWKKAYAEEGDAGLVRKKPVAKSHPRQLPPDVVEKILHLRRVYHLGPQRITWYLDTLPRGQDLVVKCVSHARPKRLETVAATRGTAGDAHTPVCQTSSRASDPGGREVPHAQSR